jgi:hypothetical protein
MHNEQERRNINTWRGDGIVYQQKFHYIEPDSRNINKKRKERRNINKKRKIE